MEPLRILVLTPWFPTPQRPVDGIFVRDQAEALAGAASVRVLHPRVTGLPTAWAAEGDAVPCAVPVDRPRATAPTPRVRSWAHAAFLRAARRGLRRAVAGGFRPDLIHAHVALPAGWAAVELGEEAGLPVVHTEHSGPFDALLATAGDRRRVRRALTGARSVLAVGAALAERMAAFAPEVRVEVLPDLVSSVFFEGEPRPAPSGSPVPLLAVALLTPGKGIDVLLRACRRLVDAGAPPFLLTVLGDGPARAELEALARSLDLGARCRFAGLADRAGVRAALRASAALVLPSRGETFGLVLAEAQACGVPAVATRCGGPEQIVEPGTGLLVPVDDDAALAEALIRVLRDPAAWDPGALRARAEARYGAAAVVPRLLAVYARAAGREAA